MCAHIIIHLKSVAAKIDANLKFIKYKYHRSKLICYYIFTVNRCVGVLIHTLSILEQGLKALIHLKLYSRYMQIHFVMCVLLHRPTAFGHRQHIAHTSTNLSVRIFELTSNTLFVLNITYWKKQGQYPPFYLVHTFSNLFKPHTETSGSVSGRSVLNSQFKKTTDFIRTTNDRRKKSRQKYFSLR